MSKSLQDQLLGAGVVDKKKAKKLSKEKQKQKNINKRNNLEEESEASLAAQSAKLQKKEKDLALNKKRNEEAEKKAIAAQVEQLIEHYKIDRKHGEHEYNFADGKNVKKLHVSQETIDQLSRGRLCIVSKNGVYEVIPKPIADKIAERDAKRIVVNNYKTNDETPSDDEDETYYAQFEIPDDLMW